MTARFGHGGGACRCQECRDEHIRQANAAVARLGVPADVNEAIPYNFGQRIRELEAEVARLEKWASKEYGLGFDAGRKESAALVREQGRFLPWNRLADAIWPEGS